MHGGLLHGRGWLTGRVLESLQPARRTQECPRFPSLVSVLSVYVRVNRGTGEQGIHNEYIEREKNTTN